jgi:tetratricopeptide (TPR) repeat protein
MTRDAAIFGISGTMFGLILGWIIGSQQPTRPAVTPAPTAAQAPAGQTTPAAPPPLDVQQVTALEAEAKTQPQNAGVRERLGNLYFDAERFDQAIQWYEASLALDKRNVNVSTDLAVSYYYSRQPDRALQQIEQSLAIEPAHAKTLLNQGIIRALGKQDLAGAFESWSRVVQVAPNTPEASRAQQLLTELKNANHGSGAPGASPAPGGSQ